MKIKIKAKTGMKRAAKFKKGILAGAVLAAAGLGAAVAIRPPAFLKVQEIQVLTPMKHLSEVDLVKLAQIRKGDKLLTLSLARVRSNLLRYPWIRDVRLYKRIPGRLLIEVEEQTPAALLEFKREGEASASLYLVNGDGHVFKKAEDGDLKDFPIITGLAEDGVRAGTKKLLPLLRFFDTSESLSRLGVSEIRAKDDGNVTLYTKEPCIRLEMGDGDWEEKLGRFVQAWESIRTMPKKPKAVDLSFRKRIVVRQQS